MPTYRKVGTLKERMRALDFLRTVCRSDGEYSVYDNGWSDKKVSRHIRTLSTRVIADLRREYLGKSQAHLDRWNSGLGQKMAAARQAARQTPPTPTPTPAASQHDLGLAARITLLERRLSRLEDNLIDEAIKGMNLNDRSGRH